ncbi:hypothetical protein CDD81_3601 [Ophiocordyceps australis]|uniref:Uncharacterized protein n=1 Tax=Ophiocordyceps australis TaxID=1399860 RepID=A0A2C5YDB9_9HYPO|nr:hypothetical protein CDD81_3601 [Ophiocordyceps australis]
MPFLAANKNIIAHSLSDKTLRRMGRFKKALSVWFPEKGPRSPRCETADDASKDVLGQVPEQVASAQQENPVKSPQDSALSQKQVAREAQGGKQDISSSSSRQENPAKTQDSIIGNLWVKATEDLGNEEREKLGKIIKRIEQTSSKSPLPGEKNNDNGLLTSINSVVEALETRDKKQGRRSEVENRILTTTLAIKELGDAAVKFDQSGYASLGWSIVTSGLRIAAQAMEAREFILQSASLITSFMTRYAAYERLYRGEFWRDQGYWRDFDRHLTSVYTALLRFIVTLDDYLQEASPRHAAHAILPLEDRPFYQAKESLCNADNETKDLIPVMSELNARALHSAIQESEKHRPACSNQRVLNCLQSLAFREMEDRPKDIDMKKITEGTCQWLLRHDTYTHWNASDRSLLWIKGKPGSGKSTLLRYAFNNAIAASSNGGNKTTMSPLGLFRALLNQILLFEPPDPAQEINVWFENQCKTYGNPGLQWEWHLGDVQRFFKQVLTSVLAHRPVLLFIDALDECGEENASQVIGWFQQFIQNLSRDICPERENDQDIFTFIETALGDRIQRCRRLRYSLDMIQKEILRTPEKLYDIYEELAQDMKDKKASWRLIQWICFTERPLDVEELKWAMVLDCDAPNPRRSLEEYNCLLPQDRQQTEIRLTDLTAGLAELTSLSGQQATVQFIHQSVQDYFKDKGFRTLQPEYNLSGSNVE